jgi:putative hydrolase of the HAD superfamily
MIKYILFDVSGTLLYKPDVINNIYTILNSNGINVNLKTLIYNHKVLTETIIFPDRTNKSFYNNFNAQLIYSIGAIPNNHLLEQIYKECTYKPWVKFEDTDILSELNLPLGILSNFNSTLEDKLFLFFDNIFKHVLVSEVLKVAKPDIKFFEKALEIINLNPDEILYIGDSVKLDIEPAKKVGFNTLLIDRDCFYSKSSGINIINNLSQIKDFI